MTIAINEEAIADFHIHTTESDGILPARAILDAAYKKSKINYLCFTDHHTTRAYDKIEAIKEWYGIEVLPGIEISTSDYKSLHIIGIGMSEREKMESVLSKISNTNIAQLLQIVVNLKEKGIILGDEFLHSMTKTSNISREKIALELVKQGYSKDVKTAYKQYVSAYSATGTTTTKLSAKEAIEFINKSGGIASIAHPKSVIHRQSRKHLTNSEWEQLLEKLVGYGLQGIECIAPSHSPKNSREFFDSQAKNFNLLRTGGNDFHGNRQGMMEEIGNPNIKQQDVDKLLNAVKRKNALIIKRKNIIEKPTK